VREATRKMRILHDEIHSLEVWDGQIL